MAVYNDVIHDLVRKTVENNLWRQRKCVNLIPSENTPSLFVKLLEMSDPSGRYAEHKTALKKEREALSGSGALKGDQIYYYQGTEFIYEVEERLKAEMKAYFGCHDVETRVISGQMANEVVFKSMVKFLSKGGDGLPALSATGRLPFAMNNGLNAGGHLSAQPFGALFNFLESEPVAIPLEEKNPYKVNVPAMLSIVEEKMPPLIIFGKSVFLHAEPVKALSGHIAKMAGYHPVVMYDGAHVLGILGPCFQDPVKEGANIVTGSTHKTFFGPQRGVIGVNFAEDSPYAKFGNEIRTRTFPGSTSNHHLGTQLALLGAALEMRQFREEYQKDVTGNAKAFARYLFDKGIPIEGGEEDGFTDTHQVVMRVKKFADGKEIATRLEKNNIIVNFQALPDDETFYHPSGIRMGVQEMTRFGVKTKDFETLAGLIARIIINNEDVGGEVSKFRANFSKMRYTFAFEETKGMLSSIFKSVFSDSEYFEGFVSGLK